MSQTVGREDVDSTECTTTTRGADRSASGSHAARAQRRQDLVGADDGPSVGVFAVALGILTKLRPENPAADSPIWINSRDLPLRDLDSVLKRVMKKKAIAALFPEPRPGYRLPDRHSLRRTCASAVAQVAPISVVAAILGHAPTSVTDLYVSTPLAVQLIALDRAALLIDGDPSENVVALAAKTALKTGRAAQVVRAR